MKRVGENLSVGRAFGTAYEKDGLLIIPVALVAGGGGGGGGPESSTAASSAETERQTEPGEATSGEGAGAGFGGLVMPVGTYVVRDEEVRWVPAVNVTLIALVALAVVRLAIRSTAKTRRRRHN
jgi:uncharacterized spore protein YtfJ